MLLNKGLLALYASLNIFLKTLYTCNLLGYRLSFLFFQAIPLIEVLVKAFFFVQEVYLYKFAFSLSAFQKN